jgi:SAM-dependent methyltransferase
MSMITVWTQGDADDHMPQAMLVDTLSRVQNHPWWHARASLAIALLKNCGVHPPAGILDVGCGWGVNLQALEKEGYHTTGLDISRRILDLIDLPERRLIEADLNQDLPDDFELYPGLLLLDVIEHLDDDKGIIKRLAPLTLPGGILIVSVPARPDLFSDFDGIQGHRRRYMPETLRSTFEDSGYALEHIFWWGAWMVPVLRWTRLMASKNEPTAHKSYADYLRLPVWPGPLVMKALFAWEHNRCLQGKLSTGTSLFAVARRLP